MLIGIVTKDRYEGLDVLIKSLKPLSHINILVIDASDIFRNPKYITDDYPNVQVFRNDIRGYQQVVHNKNIIIHNFLRNNFKHLFILEDDIKILDCDVFEKYIEVSTKYNLPHMNFLGNPYLQENLYHINEDIQVSEKLQGVFSFYTRECIERVGLMNWELCHNCWEHVEYTARIHKEFNFNPVFNHYPDISNSWEYIKMQGLPSSIGSNNYIQEDKIKMLNSLQWKHLPEVSIKRLDLSLIK